MRTDSQTLHMLKQAALLIFQPDVSSKGSGHHLRGVGGWKHSPNKKSKAFARESTRWPWCLLSEAEARATLRTHPSLAVLIMSQMCKNWPQSSVCTPANVAFSVKKTLLCWLGATTAWKMAGLPEIICLGFVSKYHSVYIAKGQRDFFLLLSNSQ